MHESEQHAEGIVTAGHTADAMLEVYKSVLSDHEGLYVSSPITSGRRYMRWLEEVGKKAHHIDFMDEETKQSHIAEVVLPNSHHAGTVVKKVRKETGRVVINPTAIPSIGGWKQEDWRTFWRRVIELHVSTTLFVDDWQYSNGCVYEFWVAHSKGLPTMDEEMQPLDLEQGIGLVLAAIADMRRHGVPTAFIEQIARDLEALPATRGGLDAK